MASFNVDRGRRDGVEVVTLEGPKGAVAHLAPALGNNCFELAIGLGWRARLLCAPRAERARAVRALLERLEQHLPPRRGV